MIAAGWGRVINLSSSAAQLGTKKLAYYAASKGGIEAWTRVVALEFAHHGISPSFIDTPMRFAAEVADFEGAAVSTPMGRSGQPEDVAATVSFLASDVAAYLTGQVIRVNGGLAL